MMFDIVLCLLEFVLRYLAKNNNAKVEGNAYCVPEMSIQADDNGLSLSFVKLCKHNYDLVSNTEI